MIAHRVGRAIVAGAVAAQIHAGAKALAFAANGDHRAAFVLQPFQRVGEFIEQLRRQCVRRLWPIEHDPAERFFVLDADRGIFARHRDYSTRPMGFDART